MSGVWLVRLCGRIGCMNPLPGPTRTSGRRRRFCSNACAVQHDRPPVGSGPHRSRHPWPGREWVASAYKDGKVIWSYGSTAEAAAAAIRDRLHA